MSKVGESAQFQKRVGKAPPKKGSGLIIVKAVESYTKVHTKQYLKNHDAGIRLLKKLKKWCSDR
jgi:hypothetical protein